jgi:hypothetical protein
MADSFEVRPNRFREQRGYLIVLFVIIIAFVGVVAAMQALVLTSVATTSRAYDSYRQSSTEVARVERVVAEALLDQRQISIAPITVDLRGALNLRLAALAGSGATVTLSEMPESLPRMVTFPDATAPADALSSVPADIASVITPEVALLAGTRFVAYGPMEFEFTSERQVLEITRAYKTRVRAQLIAVPLTRFAVAAYDLPAEIGIGPSSAAAGPASLLPGGLVPRRDTAFVTDLQRDAGVLPYHYRRRAALSAAYQYVFSQRFVDRVTEYAGITHFCDLSATGTTATLAGMTRTGPVTTWDVGSAGSGTYGTISMMSDAAVIFTEEAGRTLQLRDSNGASSASAMLLLLLGPADNAAGALVVDVGTISRPVVIIGYNVRVVAQPGAALNGALFLDPASSIAPNGPLTVGHLSYWAGTVAIPLNSVVTGQMPAAAEMIAPRVVYVATQGNRL